MEVLLENNKIRNATHNIMVREQKLVLAEHAASCSTNKHTAC